MSAEEWRDVLGYEGRYKVSDLGRVRGVHGRLLKTFLNVGGYPALSLYRDKKPKTLTVHRLVAKAFVPSDEGRNDVNHVDGNKANAAANNLEWVTKAENARHAFRTGLTKLPPPPDLRGDLNGRSKLTIESVLTIKLLRRAGRSQAAIALSFGISQTAVGRIVRGESWVNA